MIEKGKSGEKNLFDRLLNKRVLAIMGALAFVASRPDSVSKEAFPYASRIELIQKFESLAKKVGEVGAKHTKTETLPVRLFHSYDMLIMHNFLRRDKGLPTLRIDPALTEAAQIKADYLAQHHKFEHGIDWWDTPMRLLENEYGHASYESVGENLAWVQPDRRGGGEAEVVQLWIHSPVHYANIINPMWQLVGFAEAEDPQGRDIYVTEFGVMRN